jgi:DNA modification methylase
MASKISEGRRGSRGAKRRAGVKPDAGQPFKLKFAATDVVMRDPQELKPFPNNPKIHTTKQVDAIAANITEFGFDQPVLIDEADLVLKGHGRRLAAIKVGCLVPTVTRRGLTEDQKLAIVISDNALPAMTGFDQRLLKPQLTHLAKVDFPLHLTGFDNIRLATFGVNVGNAGAGGDPDDEGELQERVVSARGDIWLLGEHRLMCGDSSNGKTVEKLLGDDDPQLMATDPPYKYEHDRNGGGIYRKPSTSQAKKIIAAGVDKFEVSKLCELRETNVIFTSKELVPDYLNLAIERRLKWDLAVLHRQAALPAHNGHLIPDLDYVLIIGAQAPKPGLETADYSKLFSTGHWERPVPWAKPVALMQRILRLYSAAGDAVFEPYCGSGTTMLAAETLGRRCLAIELAPEYVDLAVRRWQTFTKMPATLQATGKSFDQVARERSKKRAA